MKKKIVFSLLDSPALGGAEQYVFSHLRFLNNNGYGVLLATNNQIVKSEFLKRLNSKEKQTFKITNLPYRLDAIGNLRGLIKFFLSLPKAVIWCFLILKRLRIDYDQVICLWPGFSDRLVFSPIAKFLKCKLVWIEIGPLYPVFKRNFGFPKILYFLSQKFPDYVVTISKYSMSSILRDSKIQKRKVKLVYPGIEVTRNKTRLKKKNNSSIFSVVARLAHENEVDMVLKAFPLFLGNNKNSHLWIVGTGPQEDELKKLAQKLGIKKHVAFFGFLSEEGKMKKIKESDFFIFPRAWSWDGFGITTIEALSQGIPVLTSRFGPQVEIVRDGIEGFLYKPHDPLDLAKKMSTIVDLTSQERLALSMNALRRADYFSEKKSNLQILNLIRDLKQTI